MDMAAPFLHEFTYQAMANDLLPIQDGTKYTFVKCPFLSFLISDVDDIRYKFQSSLGAYEDKTATLSDADNVWTAVRHLHMREAIDKLMTDFNKFLEDNAVFKGSVLLSICEYVDNLWIQRSSRFERHEGHACQPSAVPRTKREGIHPKTCHHLHRSVCTASSLFI